MDLETSEKLELVIINKANVRIAALSAMSPSGVYPNVFDKDSFDKFPGMVQLHVKERAIPKQLPCRNVPLAILEEVKTEQDALEKSSVLEQVTEPTEWVSQMAVASKRSGEIRIYIDPKPLDAVLLRERYKLPKVEDVITKFDDCDIFSNLDI